MEYAAAVRTITHLLPTTSLSEKNQQERATKSSRAIRDDGRFVCWFCGCDSIQGVDVALLDRLGVG
jgi:hypothetical protein